MLQQPMMEKLHALKLRGLLEALERQEQDETARELPSPVLFVNDNLHAARQLIAGQLGVIAASRLLSHFRHEAEPKVAEVLLTFVGIDSETDALPIGAVRGDWSPGALKRKDREIAEAEQFYRETALNAAAELLRLLDVPS